LKLLIPWHVFIDALKDQSPVTIDRWLQRWRFTDAGVVLLEPEQLSFDPTQSANADSHAETDTSGPRSVVLVTHARKLLSDIERDLKVTRPHLGGQLLRDL
jgi:hypothetical protein